MNTGGDAAEQVVRLSIEGAEVAAKLTGAGIKNLAILLATVLKEEQKTKGKARLTNLLKCGKELSVFSVEKKDLRKFSKEANQYGVLYCVVKSKYGKDGKELVDIIARAEDGAKINRIADKLKLGVVDRGKIVREVEKGEPYQDIKKESSKEQVERQGEGAMETVESKGKKLEAAMNEKELRSKPILTKEHVKNDVLKDGEKKVSGKPPLENKKPSVRIKLQEYQRISRIRLEERAKALSEPEKKPSKSTQNTHMQPNNGRKPKGKSKGRGGR